MKRLQGFRCAIKQSRKTVVKTNRIICLGLFLLTLGVYFLALRNDFIALDDEKYVRANLHVQQGLTGEAIRWAFTTDYCCNWHPLTWLSHMLDCRAVWVADRGDTI